MPTIHKPTWHLNGTWTRLHSAERLRRSSHILSVINNTAYIFGGEVHPRQPVDSQLDILSLSPDTIKLQTTSPPSPPSPRVGSASTTLNSTLYLFSGRGGPDMSPLSESGSIWAFHVPTSTWTLIPPADTSRPFPQARSYHCATSDGVRTLFIHAGCPASGRLSDLWKFDVESRAWTRCADAPGQPRGGTSIAYLGGKVYRMGGFDGEREIGGRVDVYDVSGDEWETEVFAGDGKTGPGARSVCAVVGVRVGGKEMLVTLFGERDPSGLGHEGAGKMLGDVWMWDLEERWWTRIEAGKEDGVPDPRGWFDADVVRVEGGNDKVVVHGGLGEDNERLMDVWVLSFQVGAAHKT